MQFSLWGFIGELKYIFCRRICSGTCTLCATGGATGSGLWETLESKVKGCWGTKNGLTWAPNLSSAVLCTGEGVLAPAQQKGWAQWWERCSSDRGRGPGGSQDAARGCVAPSVADEEGAVVLVPWMKRDVDAFTSRAGYAAGLSGWVVVVVAGAYLIVQLGTTWGLGWQPRSCQWEIWRGNPWQGGLGSTLGSAPSRQAKPSSPLRGAFPAPAHPFSRGPVPGCRQGGSGAAAWAVPARPGVRGSNANPWVTGTPSSLPSRDKARPHLGSDLTYQGSHLSPPPAPRNGEAAAPAPARGARTKSIFAWKVPKSAGRYAGSRAACPPRRTGSWRLTGKRKGTENREEGGLKKKERKKEKVKAGNQVVAAKQRVPPLPSEEFLGLVCGCLLFGLWQRIWTPSQTQR